MRSIFRAGRRCLRRMRWTWRRPSSPSTGPERLRAGSRCGLARADRFPCGSDSRVCVRADLLRELACAAADLPFESAYISTQRVAAGRLRRRCCECSRGRRLTGVVEDGFVHHVDGGRFVVQDHRSGRKRFEQMLEADHHPRLWPWGVGPGEVWPRGPRRACLRIPPSSWRD